MANLNLLVGLVIVFCWTSPSGSDAANPGLKARITQSGLDYLRDVGLQILEKEVEQLKISDISGDAHVDVVGKIYYTISNIRITSFAIPSATLTTREGVGLVLSASRLTLSVSGNWHYSNHGWIHVSDSGTFDGRVSGTTLGLTLRIGVDKTGRPTISSTSGDCSFNAGSVNVKLHGGASWLYNLFSHNIDDALKSALNRQTCSLITKEVNTNLQKQLAKLKTEAPIDQNAVIDYSFVAPPTFSGHIDTSHKGEVFPRDKPRTEALFTVPVIPPDYDVSRHIFLWVTDYLFETAGYVYYEAGIMAYNVTQDKLPPGKYSLNTSSMDIKLVLPNVSKMYPNMLLEIDVRATAPPAVNISEAHLGTSVQLDLDFFVNLPNKSKVYLFTLNATVFGSTILTSNGSRLMWKSNLVKVDVGLKRSTIGKFDLKYISGGINFACQHLLIPWLNSEGEKGLPLPTSPNINLDRTVIKQGKGFIRLGADIQFTPSAEGA